MNVVQKVDIKPFNSSEIQSGKIGSTYFSFIDKLAKLRQVILTTDGQGNIVIDRSSQRRIKTVLLSQYGNNQSNILSSSSTFDNTKRFSVYRSYSQGNPLGNIDDPQTPSQLSNRLGTTAFDKQIRPTRQYNFITDSSSSDANLKNRAAWEANIRRAQSRIFNCTVKGFVATNDNIIWQPNLLVEVSDEFSNTQGLFLIKDVTYRISTGGEFTDLALVTKDAFTLQAEQDARDAKVNKQGVNYVDLKAGETY